VICTQKDDGLLHIEFLGVSPSAPYSWARYWIFVVRQTLVRRLYQLMIIESFPGIKNTAFGTMVPRASPPIQGRWNRLCSSLAAAPHWLS
jgi:hypothetical protein